MRPLNPQQSSVGLPTVVIAEQVHENEHVLLWQVRGKSGCTLGGPPQTLVAGYALWVPAGVVHSLRVHADSVVLPMLFDARPVWWLREPTWFRVDAELRTQLLALLQVQNSIIRPDVDLETRVVRMLRMRAVTPTALPFPRARSAAAIAVHLERNPSDTRRVAELAGSFHVSARTVERAFLTETGMTLRDWRLRRRMEVAGDLLCGDVAVDTVAGSVGYRSTSAFRRAFKRCVGIPPSEYARRYRVP